MDSCGLDIEGETRGDTLLMFFENLLYLCSQLFFRHISHYLVDRSAIT